MISSPYDTDARFARKGATQWVGYKAHLTETCDDAAPRLITHIQTSVAPVPDGEATSDIHGTLADKDLLPDKHIVDAGYLDAELLARLATRLQRRSAWTDTRRQRMAGARSGGLRGERLPYRMGRQASDLPAHSD